MNTEWVHCPECGQPVHQYGSGTIVTEVDAAFRPTDVEHECPDRSRR